MKAYKFVETLMSEVKLKREGRPDTKLKPPAAMFSRELAGSAVGTLRQDVEDLLRQENVTWPIPLLNGLGKAEWWALNFLRFVDADNPPPHQNALEET